MFIIGLSVLYNEQNFVQFSTLMSIIVVLCISDGLLFLIRYIYLCTISMIGITCMTIIMIMITISIYICI